MEKTFVMIKPNAVQRNLVGEIIKRIEQKGFMIHALKFIHVTTEQAQKHYAVHKERPFFNELVTSITSSPVVVIVISGNDAVAMMRLLAGATKPIDSLPGTIRGDFSNDIGMNVIHTSDSVENAKYEMNIYFNEKEILNYDKTLNREVFSK